MLFKADGGMSEGASGPSCGSHARLPPLSLREALGAGWASHPNLAWWSPRGLLRAAARSLFRGGPSPGDLAGEIGRGLALMELRMLFANFLGEGWEGLPSQLASDGQRLAPLDAVQKALWHALSGAEPVDPPRLSLDPGSADAGLRGLARIERECAAFVGEAGRLGAGLRRFSVEPLSSVAGLARGMNRLIGEGAFAEIMAGRERGLLSALEMPAAARGARSL